MGRRGKWQYPSSLRFRRKSRAGIQQSMTKVLSGSGRSIMNWTTKFELNPSSTFVCECTETTQPIKGQKTTRIQCNRARDLQIQTSQMEVFENIWHHTLTWKDVTRASTNSASTHASPGNNICIQNVGKNSIIMSEEIKILSNKF